MATPIGNITKAAGGSMVAQPMGSVGQPGLFGRSFLLGPEFRFGRNASFAGAPNSALIGAQASLAGAPGTMAGGVRAVGGLKAMATAAVPIMAAAAPVAATAAAPVAATTAAAPAAAAAPVAATTAPVAATTAAAPAATAAAPAAAATTKTAAASTAQGAATTGQAASTGQTAASAKGAAAGAKGAVAGAPAAAGLLGKLGIGNLLAGASGSKLAMAAIAVAPVLLVAAVIYTFSGGKKKDPPATKHEAPTEPKKGWDMGKMIANKGSLGLLALVSLIVAWAGILIGYKYLHTETVTVAVGSRGGESAIMMRAVKTVVEKHYPRVKIKIRETVGTKASLEAMDRGEAQMATVEGDLPAGPKATAVAVLFTDVYQLLMHDTATVDGEAETKPEAGEDASAQPKDAVTTGANAAAPAPKAAKAAKPGVRAKQFSDLKGKTIALPKLGGPYQAFLFVAAHYGLKEKDFSFTGGDEASAVEVFANKDANAIFQIRSILNPDFARLSAKGGVSLVPIDQGPAIQAESPNDVSTVIPKGAFRGNPPFPPVDTPTVSTHRLLLASADADEEAVHTITKVLMENRQEIAQAVPDSEKSVRALVGEVSQPPMRTGLAAAIHPGALAYYDHNKNSFAASHADSLAFGIVAFGLIWMWIAELRRTRAADTKVLADGYNQKMLTFMKSAKTADSEEELVPVETELSAMMVTAIEDLNSNRLTDASFQSFHTIWKLAMDAVKERKAELAPPPVAALPAPTEVAAPPEPKPRWSFANLLPGKTT